MIVSIERPLSKLVPHHDETEEAPEPGQRGHLITRAFIMAKLNENRRVLEGREEIEHTMERKDESSLVRFVPVCRVLVECR